MEKGTHHRKNGRRGRCSIEEMGHKEIRTEVKELLQDLTAATDPDDKKRLRRMLRRRGHRGGLGKTHK